MPVETHWEAPSQIVVVQEYRDAWTWEDFYHACVNDTVPLMQSVPHTVHIISDFTNSGPIPFGGAISNARNAVRFYPDNWGLLIIVTPSMFMRSLVNTFRRAYPRDYGLKTYAVNTLAEAHALVDRYDGTP